MGEMEANQDKPIKMKKSPTELELTSCETCLMYFTLVILTILTAGLVWCCQWYELSPFSARVWTFCGKIRKVETGHGLKYNCNFALDSFGVDLRVR